MLHQNFYQEAANLKRHSIKHVQVTSTIIIKEHKVLKDNKQLKYLKFKVKTIHKNN